MNEQPTTSKNTRLINYLEALVRLRTKPIQNISAYEHVLWMGKIPNEVECFSRHRDPAQDDDPDLWIEINKPIELPLPTPPSICNPWIGKWDRNDFINIPHLQESIVDPQTILESKTDSDDENESHLLDNPPLVELHLKDHQDVISAWDQYVSNSWTPWTSVRARWNGIQEIYKKLFDIHSYMMTRGETVELILGVGLLSWRTQGQTISRHLITAKVDLSFDEKRGCFTVRPHSADVQLHPEFDMLPHELVPPSIVLSADEGLRAAQDDIWNTDTINPVLKSIAHSLSDKGIYLAKNFSPERKTQEDPIVEFAPSLILRKRSTRSVNQFLKSLREQVNFEEAVPAGWQDLTEQAPVDNFSNKNYENESENHAKTETSTTHYFPLLANEEQRRILKALDHPIGALVQGPPGTGKSHTIANLICHLLATGKRILITAQTPRALQVLKDKLPDQIRPLAVSLLGAGADERKSLEESVQGITEKFDVADPAKNRQQASTLSDQRSIVNKEIARLSLQLRSVRERDTMEHNLQGYCGTATSIAKEVASEKNMFSWFCDSIQYDSKLDDPSPSLKSILAIQRRLSDTDHYRLGLTRPTIGLDILESFSFSKAVKNERIAKSGISSIQAKRLDLDKLANCDSQEQLQTAIDSVQNLEVSIANTRSRPQKWIDEALSNILSKLDRPWFELHNSTEETLLKIRTTVRDEDRKSLSVPQNIEWDQLVSDSQMLKQHLDDGQKLRFWFAKSGSIRKCRYLTRDVRIDGKLCDSTDALNSLMLHCNLHLDLAHIWKLWNGKSSANSDSLALQTQEIEELQEALNDVLETYKHLELCMEFMSKIPAFAEPEWGSPDSRKIALQSMQLRIHQIDLVRSEKSLCGLFDSLKHFSKSNTVDQIIVDELISAVIERDIEKYDSLVTQVETLNQNQTDLITSNELLEIHKQAIPKFTALIESDLCNPQWDTFLSNLGAAINFAKAENWLQVFINEADLHQIEINLKRLNQKSSDLLTKEAVLLAWAHSFDRMEESHRRALMGWQQAMKALGKGTGKHAARHRREGQKQLNKCRPAIPAWIMPLHRVFDSIDPKPGMFDVIIVDEASQCGPDALPLFFLGKKILIVGDDKQISPAHVGIKRDYVHQHMNEFLDDFEHKSAFDFERSLFDHGELRIGNRVVLREHFRSMPEIIRFSNDLCYTNTPLIPLRQYPPDRLDPIVVHHVSDGFIENKELNKPEAERLATSVANCCKDPKYTRNGAKLTFGVISLKGWKQAEYIEHILLNLIGAEEMAERRLVCGDASSFQGDERDVIFLSMVIATNDRYATMAKFSDQQRFNVAASRARDQMWLYHSVQTKDLSEKCVRRKLLDYFIDPHRSAKQIAGVQTDKLEQQALRANRSVDPAPEPFDSWFEVDVALQISSRGYRVIPQFKIAGYSIDLVVEGNKGRLAVECDGDRWHGAEQYEADLLRQRKLERAGLIFVRIRGSSYYSNPTDAMQSTWERLDELGICPIGEPEQSSPHTQPQEVVRKEESILDNGGQAEDLQIAKPEIGTLQDSIIATDRTPPENAPESEQSSHHAHPQDVIPRKEPDLDNGSQAEKSQIVKPKKDLFQNSIWDRLDELGIRPTEKSEPEPKPEPEPENLLNANSESVNKTIETSAVAAEAISDSSSLPTYGHWIAVETKDPRIDQLHKVMDGLLSIIEVEGPIIASRAYRLYANAAGLQRTGSALRSIFNKAVSKAKREGLVELEQTDPSAPMLKSVVRLSGTPAVHVRTRGDRTVYEIPPSEIAQLMKHILRDSPRIEDEDLLRSVQEFYNLQRLKAATRDHLVNIHLSVLEDMS